MHLNEKVKYMSDSFVFKPDGNPPTLDYTRDENGQTTVETYRFKQMYGSVEGQATGGLILVPYESNKQFPPEVMRYMQEQEEKYGFTFAPESRIEATEVQ